MTELEQRLLLEARDRASGRVLRRFLVLMAAALGFAIYGVQTGDVAIGIVVAAVLVGVAVYSLWSERRTP